MLRVMGFGAFALAALGLLLAFDTPIFIGAAISLAAAGTLFLAADKVIIILGEIRDRLPALPKAELVDAPAAFTGPVRSAAEIDADLKKMRAQA